MKRLENENLQFGKRLKKMRVQAGLSAESLSATIGVAASTYREWENGRAITGQPYEKIAAALNVSVYQILGIEDYNKSEIITRLDSLRKVLNEIQTLL